MGTRFGDVALLGLGISTQAAGAYLANLPAGEVGSITVYAGTCGPAARERAHALEELGVAVVYDTEELAGTYDLGVVSPGIPATGDFYRSGREHCRELVSEPELAWRESPRNWVAVTGTNGKTTTTSLACELIRAAGIAVRPVGNIGLAPIACVADRAEGEVFVAELSSFQLESSVHFSPRVAVLLNVTPDHVEWHGSLEAYAAAKECVFANLTPRDLALVGTDEVCRAVADRLRLRGLRVAVIGEEPCPCARDAAWVDASGRLTVRLNGADHVLCTVDDMRIKGPHNVFNALAASACALEMGADAAAVARELTLFAPLAHRVEPCGEHGGVAFVDDSKATNTDAVVKALDAFPQGRTIVLLGGHDKGTDLTDLSRAVASRCRAAVAFGEAGNRLAGALEAACANDASSSCAVVRAEHMRDAFDAACAAALPGDTVLLSPACSSFDEFSGYAERGRVFQEWVRARSDAPCPDQEREGQR